MADGLYQRYMAAARAYQEHARQCDFCSEEPQCPVGERLHESLARLQDAHLNRLRHQRR